jgi:4-amino-4-deoxy-L-arabinose transferase-like glycosyltransferase
MLKPLNYLSVQRWWGCVKSCDKWFLVGLSFLLITRLAAIFLYSDLGPYADEDNYALRGTSFLRMLFTAPPELHEHYLKEFYYEGYWAPLYSLIIGPFHILGEETAVRIFLVVCDIFAGILFYRLALRVISKNAASVALFLYAINPFLWVASFSILSEGVPARVHKTC